MANPLFQSAFRLRIQAAIAAAEQAGRISHPGVVGQMRELLARELLRPVLSGSIAFGTGKIVDHLGNESDQIDLIVYDRSLMPPLLYSLDETLGLYPVEACLYAIEVKSRTSARELDDAVKKARSVTRLRYVPEFCVNGIPRERAIPTLFAFGSDLTTAEAERDRWMEASSDEAQDVMEWTDAGWTRTEFPLLRVVCIVDAGYGYYDARRSSYGWRSSEGENDEVLWYMAGIVNSVPRLAAPRQNLPFGHYFVSATPP